MIQEWIERCMGRIENPDRNTITSEPWLARHFFN